MKIKLSLRPIILYLLNKLFKYKPQGKINSDLIKKGILEIGEFTYQWEGLHIDFYEGSEAKVKIGKFCSISKNVRIITGGIHPTNWVSTYPFRAQLNLPGKNKDGMPTTKGNIIIGNDVWIGTGVTILSGLTIGDGAVITAGAVVTKNIPDYAIAGGIPARVIKYRFNEDQIKQLLKIKWWFWEEKQIKKNIHLLSSSQIDEFIALNKNNLPFD